MRQIIFKQQNGTEIVRSDTDNQFIGAEHTLNADEDIIGIYGSYDDYNILGIGMIVWTPPKFWLNLTFI